MAKRKRRYRPPSKPPNKMSGPEVTHVILDEPFPEPRNLAPLSFVRRDKEWLFKSDMDGIIDECPTCGHRRFWHEGENGEGKCTRLDCECTGMPLPVPPVETT